VGGGRYIEEEKGVEERIIIMRLLLLLLLFNSLGHRKPFLSPLAGVFEEEKILNMSRGQLSIPSYFIQGFRKKFQG
jgi:hypothetical protein